MVGRQFGLTVSSAILLMLMSATAAAQPEPRPPCGVRQARAHFELGQAHLKLNAYEAALADFEAGYACIPMPIFLYDIAQMARLSGQRAKALELYRRYLAADPQAREKVFVERWIAILSRSKSRAEGRAETPPRPSPAAPVVIAPTAQLHPFPTAPEPAGAPVPAAAPAPPPPPDLLVATHPAPVPEKRSRRGTWIALGVVGGALVIGGAITAGVLLTRPSDRLPKGFADLGAVDALPH